MIHTIRSGDTLTMVGPDGAQSAQFTLAEAPMIHGSGPVWIYREYDMPLIVPRGYALDSTFILHSRRGHPAGRYRFTDSSR